MGGQLAKIYLRGTLMSITAAGLTDEQKQECQKLMEKAWDNPLLQKAKTEFSKALARTIGNEYRDFDFGKQDARLAFWKAAVMVMYHESCNCNRCGKHYITSFKSQKVCNRQLTYWCNQETKEKMHGEVKLPIYVDKSWMTKWLADKPIETIDEWLVDPNDEPAIEQIMQYSAIGEICPQCYAIGALHFLYNGECCGELIPSWSPKQEIAEEAEFHCPECNHRWVDHESKNICEKCGNDKNEIYHIKMKKFFQTVLFNYLKQILRENKPPSIKEIKDVIRPADITFLNVTKKILDESIIGLDLEYSIDNVDNKHIIKLETNLLPQRAILELNTTINEFKLLGIVAIIDKNGIYIASSLKTDNADMLSRPESKREFIKFISFDSQGKNDNEETNFNEFCEFKAGNYKKNSVEERLIDELDTISVIKKRLPNSAKAILDLIVNTPIEYIKRFDTSRVYKTHVAQFLQTPLETVEENWSYIENECKNVGIAI